MSKYEPLTNFLEAQSLDRVPLTFKEIERLLGFKLPASALKYRPWWANTGGSHVQSEAWLEAGFETESVDMEARRLVFRRKASSRTPPEAEPKLSLDKVYGCLSGTIQIRGDVTQPLDEVWSDQQVEA